MSMSSAGTHLVLREVGDDGLTDDERQLAALRWLAGQGSPSLTPCECPVCKTLREESWS